VRRTAVLVYASALLLVVAVIGRVFDWAALPEQWALFLWTVSLAPVGAVLLRHPMRRPALGLFVAFWGALAVLTLIVLQAIALTGRLGSAQTVAESWPLAVFGLWVLSACAFGFSLGDEPDGVPAPVDGLGIVAGGLLILASATVWTSSATAVRPTFLAAACAYVLWTVAATSSIWDWGRPRSATPAPEAPAEAAPEPAPAPS
jgi:hypothetical protein